MILHIYFIVLFIFFCKYKSIAWFMILLQIISLSGIYFTGYQYNFQSSFDWFNLFYTIILLTLIISPWKTYTNISKINFSNEDKLKLVTYLILIASFFSFIVLSATTILVFSSFTDINYFKYSEGVYVDFFYALPFNVRFLILAGYLCEFSIFLIPLHFFYQARGNRRLSNLCFFLSLNIVITGLSHFSRVAIINWLFIYLSFYILLFNTLNTNYKKSINKVIAILSILFLLYFSYVSTQRFSSDTQYNKLVRTNSLIRNPVLYSYIDYLSQSYNNGMYVLNDYKFKTFSGQLSFSPILTLLGHYGIGDYTVAKHKLLRRKLWPYHYYTFNGLVGYFVYDFGYFFALLISLIYYYIIRKLKPYNNSISIFNLLILVLLIQIPIFAIFYSALGGIVFPAFLLIPILIYLRPTTKKRYTSKYLKLSNNIQ